MKCKKRNLFISIALSFLIGWLINSNPFTSEDVEIPFGSLAETSYFHDHALDFEETSVSEHEIISEIIEGDALRHFSQTKRINSSSSTKYGLAAIKRNHPLYTSPSTLESNSRFPSGLTEARQYLISLGKLII